MSKPMLCPRCGAAMLIRDGFVSVGIEVRPFADGTIGEAAVWLERPAPQFEGNAGDWSVTCENDCWADIDAVDPQARERAYDALVRGWDAMKVRRAEP